VAENTTPYDPASTLIRDTRDASVLIVIIDVDDRVGSTGAT
jgi:hypothetical protein